MVGCFPEIVVLRQRRHLVDRGKPRAIKHFHQASFARITRHVCQALILLTRLFAQEHRGLFFRQAYALEEQAFLGQRAQVSNCKYGIFQVVEQPETENKIETPEFKNRTVLKVRLSEGNLRKSPARLRCVFCAPVETTYIQPALREHLRKKPYSTACVQCI